MSVKVNLLPDEVGARSRAGSQRAVLIGAFGVLVALLAGGWWFNEGRVTDAEERLVLAQAEVADLQAQVTALSPFAELQARAREADGTLTAALGNEVSVAGVLQDLSSVFPPNAELGSLSLSITGERSPVVGGQRVVVGTVQGQGQLLLGLAPGAERLLIDIGRAAAFDNPFLTTTAFDEDGVGSFTFVFELGPEVLTNRYAADQEAGA